MDDDEPPLKNFDTGMKANDEGFEDDGDDEDFSKDVDNEMIIHNKLLLEAIEDDAGLPLMVELGDMASE